MRGGGHKYFLVTSGGDRWSILWTVVCKDALVLASLKLVLFVFNLLSFLVEAKRVPTTRRVELEF